MSKLAKRPTDAIESKKNAAKAVEAPKVTAIVSTPAQGIAPAPRAASRGAKFACFVFGVALLASIAAGFVTGSAAVVAVAAPTLLAAMAFTRLELFESFKGGGLELKLREATADAKQATENAEHATEEAKATLSEVRALGVSLSRLSLEALARASLLGEFPMSVKLRLRYDLKEQLEKLGVSEAELSDADKTFHLLLRYKVARRIVDAAREACQVERNGATDAEYMAFQSKTEVAFDFGTLSVPTSEHLRELVADYIDEDVEWCFRNYEHFEETGELTERTLLDGRSKDNKEREKRISRKVEARKLALAK